MSASASAAQAHEAEPLRIRLGGDVTLAAPPRLNSLTTYVLLEQERWFEKETAFLRRWLRPGMNVIDIGANLGVYAVPAARSVGPTGRVFAFEPGAEPRRLLELNRSINAADNLQISGLALADRAGEATLVQGQSSELSALGTNGPGETVRVSTLDAEAAAWADRTIDFVKIDAEGAEERILDGGAEFFARQSPLVMFEIKAGNAANETLRRRFLDMGYRLFRTLQTESILVPVNAADRLDDFEVNLFAAKPDMVARLIEDGVLVDAIPDWEPGAADLDEGVAYLRTQPFAGGFTQAWTGALDPDYAEALSAYAAWRANAKSWPERCAALFFAFRTLSALCGHAPTLARLATFARVAWEAGERAAATASLEKIANDIGRAPLRGAESFWPVCPRFDALPAGSDPAAWFACGVLEQFETARTFSSLFGGVSAALPWLCGQAYASKEMQRRLILFSALRGGRPAVPAALAEGDATHLNPELWRHGVPALPAVPAARP